MTAFVVLPIFLGIFDLKYHYFYRRFYTNKICSNNFITAFLIPVKNVAKLIVIFNEKNDYF